MKGDLILHVIHISGKRMIEFGVNGLSRGDTLEGITNGTPLIYFIPIFCPADDRSKN